MCEPEFNFCFPIEMYERDEGRASGNGPPIKETRRLVSSCELRVARICAIVNTPSEYWACITKTAALLTPLKYFKV